MEMGYEPRKVIAKCSRCKHVIRDDEEVYLSDNKKTICGFCYGIEKGAYHVKLDGG